PRSSGSKQLTSIVTVRGRLVTASGYRPVKRHFFRLWLPLDIKHGKAPMIHQRITAGSEIA
ncbi:MAG: hypothetical protein ABSE57_18215, partial [Bryobacteraceae bacterium]